MVKTTLKRQKNNKKRTKHKDNKEKDKQGMARKERQEN